MKFGDELTARTIRCYSATIASAAAPFITTALHRSRNRYGKSLGEPEFRVVRYRESPEDTPYGIPMRVPSVTRFTVRDHGAVVLDVTAELDTTWTFGLGSGSGRSYMEYIDRR